MSRRLALALLGAVLLRCSADTANGTTFFVAVAWQDGWPIVALRFSGEAGTSPAFPTSTRPESPMGMLNTPQTVRIFLSNGLGGQSVDVTAEGLQLDGGVFARGSASKTVVEGHEEEVMIELSQGGSGGGAGTGGSGTGGGSAATGGGSALGGGTAIGGGPGGGTATTDCQCATGCCFAGSTRCAQLNGNWFACPKMPPSSTCVAPLCDGFTADGCAANGACQCGQGPACGPGLRCETGSCVCDEKSGCDGCCQSPSSCLARAAEDNSHCGAAGIACTSCGGMVCAAGACGASICAGASNCRSGSTCLMAAWPVCAGAASCVACPPVRTDRCAPITFDCACGDGGVCATNQVCVTLTDGGVGCRAISGG
jgi:hypothetical protein